MGRSVFRLFTDKSAGSDRRFWTKPKPRESRRKNENVGWCWFFAKKLNKTKKSVFGREEPKRNDRLRIGVHQNTGPQYQVPGRCFVPRKKYQTLTPGHSLTDRLTKTKLSLFITLTIKLSCTQLLLNRNYLVLRSFLVCPCQAIGPWDLAGKLTVYKINQSKSQLACFTILFKKIGGYSNHCDHGVIGGWYNSWCPSGDGWY